MPKRGNGSLTRRSPRKIDVNERVERAFNEGSLIDEAFDDAHQEVVRQHKQTRQPVVVWRDGKMALVSAEEIEAELKAGKGTSDKSKTARKRKAPKKPSRKR
jgi:hypothetical protein